MEGSRLMMALLPGYLAIKSWSPPLTPVRNLRPIWLGSYAPTATFAYESFRLPVPNRITGTCIERW